MSREYSDQGYDPLLPIMPSFQSTKAEIMEQFNLYQHSDIYRSDEKSTLKKKSAAASVEHTIYPMQALPEVELTKKEKSGFRFVVTPDDQVFFGKEGLAGRRIPSHFQLAQMNAEIKTLPRNYHDSQGHLALSMGRIYLNQSHRLVAFDRNSGGFRPGHQGVVKALAIIFLCAPQTLFSDHMDYIELDNGGGDVATHRFKVAELKKLVLAKFSETEQKKLIESNRSTEIIHLHGTSAALAEVDDSEISDLDLEMEKENLAPTVNQNFDSPMKTNLDRDSFGTPVKRLGASRSLFGTPPKAPMTAKKFDSPSPRPVRYLPYSPNLMPPPSTVKQDADASELDLSPPRRVLQTPVAPRKMLGRQLSLR
jgi:hypothetical protein